MPRPRRTRAEMDELVLAVGRRQLAEHGAAGLSLREVARELGVVPSGVYRYVASRDELLTRLLDDAFSSLADAVEQDIAGITEPRTRMRTLAHAMRTWALAHPAQWALIYGSPVPGYHAPAERTSGPGLRLTRHGLQAAADGAFRTPGTEDDDAARLSPPFVAQAVEELQVEATAPQVTAATRAWTALLGAVSAEVFGHFGPLSPDDGAALLEAALEIHLD